MIGHRVHGLIQPLYSGEPNIRLKIFDKAVIGRPRDF